MTKKKKPEFSISVKREVMKRSRNRYERCSIDFDDYFKGEFHHISPVVFEGDKDIDNCYIFCKNCHYASHNIKDESDLILYNYYFLYFASFKGAANYYGIDNRSDLYIKLSKDIAEKQYEKIKL